LISRYWYKSAHELKTDMMKMPEIVIWALLILITK
jgi:hypothetical protein